ncbi:hypothetical protein [Microbispora amethystogenes]|uniref:Lipopolysaccharide assembly protein A domain-containing protein n=1 Tax=Microbispora amethystogenes TaxID=1427754 RepID=A0ABQ4FM55_9ACTN|nr:hypothetical protein [Microbispora amethystogenes]GIH35895.1 hypothetical protein Mam01_60590 [Microbispora amethystogenes]
MVLLGLLLVLVAAAAVIEVSVNDTANTLPVTILDRTFNLSPFEFFIAGVVTAAVFVVGLMLITGGLRRGAVRRRKAREARLAERDRVSRLEAEKRELERRLQSSPATEAEAERDGVAPVTAAYPKVDRDRDGVDDRVEDRAAERAADRAADRAEIRAEDRARDRAGDTAPHRYSVPRQSSPDQLVAGGRHASDDRRA